MMAGLIAITATVGSDQRMEADARATLETFHVKGNAKDLDGLMEYIHDDCIVSSANQDLIRGREAFRNMYARMLSAYTNINLSVDIVETRTVGEEVEIMWYTVGRRTNATTGVVENLRSANMALFKYDQAGKMRFYRVSNHPAEPATP
ncbi:YybH family protein [Luteitalea pratensis]|nr:nuclear transport factor 2 family protein [Luteitalea pratensis]